MPKSKLTFTLLISLLINLIFSFYSFAQNNTTEEIMTFETYYPAPFGVYNEMRAKKMAVGDNYYNGSQYCWPPATCSNQIDGVSAPCWPNCNTDLVVEGNVGIGTASPDYKLSFGPDTGGASNILALVDEASPNNAMRGIGAYNSGGVYGLAFWASLGDAATVSNTRMFIDANTGNVGIGTASPGVDSATKVEIVSTSSAARTTGLVLRNNAGAINTAVSLDFTPNVNIPLARITAKRTDVGGAGYTNLEFSTYNGDLALPTKMTITPSGNVGIGTPSPTQKLHIGNNMAATPTYSMTNNGEGLLLNYGDDAGARFADIVATGNTPQGATMNLRFWTNSGAGAGTATEKMRITGSGNVGIGTASPGRKFTVVDNTGGFSAYIVNNSPGPGTQGALLLQVGAINDPTTSILDLLGGNGDREFFFNSAGEGRADGSFAGGAADYAEYFENLNAEVIEKCAIVALEEGKLRVAKKEDVFIAGVVSTFAGIIANNGDIEEEREKHPEKWTLVSLMGQVPVKVRGNIKHGDYIELDDNGIGRKAKQWHPEVIGRAMEDYDSEKTGKIKVMIK